MGGNVTAVIKSSGKSTRAEKINLVQIGRANFRKTVLDMLNKLNKNFSNIHNEYIWDTELLESGFVFNGSTSYIMNPKYSDDLIIRYKKQCGDIDITVPDNLKEKVFQFLDFLEGEQINSKCRYMGSNKPTIQSVGDQINSVFAIEFTNGILVNVQIDFEFLEYKNNKPTEWAKFSHSSDFLDAQLDIKAVNHKYLIRALVGAASVRTDIIIATPKSTSDNIKITTSKIHQFPRMLKFSVGRGIRVAYEPILDTNNEPIYIADKQVFKELPSKTSTYKTEINGMIELIFGTSNSTRGYFNSFCGVCELMIEHLTETQIDEAHTRYLDLLWGAQGRLRAQELESDNPALDYDIKLKGYLYFIKSLGLQNQNTGMITEYYKTYDSLKEQ